MRVEEEQRRDNFMIKEFFEKHDHLCFKLQRTGRHSGGWLIRIYNTTLDLGCIDPIYEHIILDSEINNSNVDFETIIMTSVINWWEGICDTDLCRIIKLENWTKVTNGLYRYVISDGCCYEIYIIHHAKDTDILTANASLYRVSDWISNKKDSEFFNRELLLNGPVMACLEKAAEDGIGSY